MSKIKLNATIKKVSEENGISYGGAKDVIVSFLTHMGSEDKVEVLKLVNKYCKCKDNGCKCGCC